MAMAKCCVLSIALALSLVDGVLVALSVACKLNNPHDYIIINVEMLLLISNLSHVD